MTCAPSTAAEAWPSAQAFTFWAKSAIRPSSTARSTVTVEPQSGERFLTLACGAVEPAGMRNVGGKRQDPPE